MALINAFCEYLSGGGQLKVTVRVFLDKALVL